MSFETRSVGETGYAGQNGSFSELSQGIASWNGEAERRIQSLSTYVQNMPDINSSRREIQYQTNSMHTTQQALLEEMEGGNLRSLGVADEYHEVQATIDSGLQECNSLVNVIDTTIRKLESLGLPGELATSDRAFLSFLFENGIAFHAAAHKATFGVELVRMGSRGPELLLQGNWISWSDFREQIVFDNETGKIITKDEPRQMWNIVSPDGFIPQDRFLYDEIYPIGRLSQEQHEQLIQLAHQGCELSDKRAVIQVLTRTKEPIVPDTWFTHNLVEHIPSHVGLRIVNAKGDVYSFGFEVDSKDSSLIVADKIFNALKTTDVQVGVPDFEETRKSKTITVTSLPIDQEVAERVLKFVSEKNRDGFRFNYLKQNCTRFASVVLNMTGHNVPSNITVEEGLWRVLPSVCDIPYIGKPLVWLAERVEKIASSVLSYITQFVSQEVIGFGDHILSVATFIPSKMSALIKNSVVLLFGGALMSPFNESYSVDSESGLERFARLIESPWDLFREDMTTGNHSVKIYEWQKTQEVTKTYEYAGPRFYGL